MKHVRHQVSPPGGHFTRLRHVTCAQPTNHRPRTCRRARHQSAADDNNGTATGDQCRPISRCIVTTTPRRTVTTALSTLRYRHWNNNRGLYRPASFTARALTITQPLLHTDNYYSRSVCRAEQTALTSRYQLKYTEQYRKPIAVSFFYSIMCNRLFKIKLTHVV